MEEESNRKLAFLDTFLEGNNEKISVLAYKEPTYIDQYLHYNFHHQKSLQGKCCFHLI